jgi:hypothetical protein
MAVACEQGTQSGFGGGFVDKLRGIGGRTLRNGHGVGIVETQRRRRGAFVAARQYRLLLVPGALAEDRIEPHAEKGGDHGEQNNRKSGHGQRSNAARIGFGVNIGDAPSCFKYPLAPAP